MIKKLVFGFVFTAFGAATMLEGGLLTNTNQSASFLRQISHPSKAKDSMTPMKMRYAAQNATIK